MNALLVHLHSVLKSDTGLTAVIPSDNIGASVRQNAGSPALEYGIDGDAPNHSGHRDIILAFNICSAAGAAEVYRAKEALEQVMTAKKLSTPVLVTDPPLTFKVDQVRLTDASTDPRNDWAFSTRCEFSLRVADLRPPTQKQ